MAVQQNQYNCVVAGKEGTTQSLVSAATRDGAAMLYVNQMARANKVIDGDTITVQKQGAAFPSKYLAVLNTTQNWTLADAD